MSRIANRKPCLKQLILAVSGFVIGVGSLVLPTPAIAEAQVILEEVIVTAQKREQSLQETPISITAFDATSIETQRIRDITDVSANTPNVQVVESPAGNAGATVAIRGSVTINPAITWEPTVGMYLDGVFLGKNVGGVFDIAELERVEVLRGPQGTLYGKNTVGGAINLITRKPSGEFSSKVRIGGGNENYREGYLSIDTPAIGIPGEGIGSLAANISGLIEQRDGFYDNVDDPFGNPLAGPRSSDEFNDVDNKAGRIAVAWEITENLRVDYSYDQSKKDAQPAMGQLTFAIPLTPEQFPPAGFNPVALGLDRYLVPTDNRAGVLGNDSSYYERSDVSGHGLTLSWDTFELGFLGDVTWKSITAWRDMKYDDAIDIDGSPIDLLHTERDIDYDQSSQEFQVVGKTETVDYVFGLYYFREKGDVFNPISFFAAFGSPTANNFYGLDNKSTAGYGQIDWRPAALNDKLTLSLGARWTREEKDSYIRHLPSALPEIPYTEASDEWTNTSPGFTVIWAATEDTNLYLRFANGWKSGGFNGDASTREDFLKVYDPETVTSVEGGIKSRFADRLQLNLTLFRNKIDDMQFSVFDGGSSASSTVANAGKATVKGLEVEFVARATENLLITANYGYLDTRYDEFLDRGVDVSNQRDFPYAPSNTASLGLDWRIARMNWGALDLRVDYSYMDEHVVYTGPIQNLSSTIDSYSLLNGRLALSELRVTDNSSLIVSIWGRNLTDEEYRRNTIPVGPWTVSYFGNPRTYGIDVTFNF